MKAGRDAPSPAGSIDPDVARRLIERGFYLISRPLAEPPSEPGRVRTPDPA